VASALHDARLLISVMDDLLHKMGAATFTGTDEHRSVVVTVNGHHQLIDIVMSDGLLRRRGVETVEQRLNEALRNANDAATASLTADQKEIEVLIAEVSNRW
jgi:DNA-binding protein YbaB